MCLQPSSFLPILLGILSYIPPHLSARQLEDISPAPSPTPVTTVNYIGATRNLPGGGTDHVQIISTNNGTLTSRGETITDQNGKPSISVNENAGAGTETVYGSNGKPQLKYVKTRSSETHTVNGSDGKPQYEVEQFANGTSVVTVFGSDGKPVFRQTYEASPGNDDPWKPPPGFPFSPDQN